MAERTLLWREDVSVERGHFCGREDTSVEERTFLYL